MKLTDLTGVLKSSIGRVNMVKCVIYTGEPPRLFKEDIRSAEAALLDYGQYLLSSIQAEDSKVVLVLVKPEERMIGI